MKLPEKRLKLNEAIKRLQFTISEKHTPNQKDADALFEIEEFIEMQHKKSIDENLLFAKLYAFVLSEMLTYYTDIDFANKEINRILSNPICIELLLLKLRNMELQNYFKRKGILDPFLKTKTVDELEDIHARYEDKLPELDPIEFANCSNNWNYDSVKYQLETQINLSLQHFKNNG